MMFWFGFLPLKSEKKKQKNKITPFSGQVLKQNPQEVKRKKLIIQSAVEENVNRIRKQLTTQKLPSIANYSGTNMVCSNLGVNGALPNAFTTHSSILPKLMSLWLHVGRGFLVCLCFSFLLHSKTLVISNITWGLVCKKREEEVGNGIDENDQKKKSVQLGETRQQ